MCMAQWYQGLLIWRLIYTSFPRTIWQSNCFYSLRKSKVRDTLWLSKSLYKTLNLTCKWLIGGFKSIIYFKIDETEFWDWNCVLPLYPWWWLHRERRHEQHQILDWNSDHFHLSRNTSKTRTWPKTRPFKKENILKQTEGLRGLTMATEADASNRSFMQFLTHQLALFTWAQWFVENCRTLKIV